MNLLKRVRNAATIERLRERARQRGRPRGYVELCQALVVQGDSERALAVAREGAKRFPRSLELADQLRLLWGQAARAERHDLERNARENPGPGSLKALGEHYIGVEELDLAIGCGQEICTRDPGVVDGPLLVGRALWKRFVRDHVAGDGRRALDVLRQAVAIDPKSLEAWKLLTEICFYVGAVSQALEAVAKVLELEPKDEDAAALHACLLTHSSEKTEEDDLIRAVDESDAPWRGYRPEEARDAAPGFLPETEIHRMLHQISTMAGVRRLVLTRVGVDIVARDGHVFAERRNPPEQLVALAATFRRRIAASAKRLGIGAFQESEIVLKGATVLAFGGMTAMMLVEVEPGARPQLAVACRDVIASLDSAPAEPAHA